MDPSLHPCYSQVVGEPPVVRRPGNKERVGGKFEVGEGISRLRGTRYCSQCWNCDEGS